MFSMNVKSITFCTRLVTRDDSVDGNRADKINRPLKIVLEITMIVGDQLTFTTIPEISNTLQRSKKMGVPRSVTFIEVFQLSLVPVR